MKVLIVGGSTNKASSVITKLAVLLEAEDSVEFAVTYNKYNPEYPISIDGYDLVLWWPDIDNEELKHYPVKDQGAVLICSKVMHENRTRIDAVTRIFNMHGNAVVAINKDGDKFEFELIDALNNTWAKTTSLLQLSEAIIQLYEWTKGAKRVSLIQNDLPEGTLDRLDYSDIDAFIKINKALADKVAIGCGNRFFGNYSTRCTRLFPSTRKGKDYFFFSPRNVDKRYISTEDLVLTDSKYYYGDRKPSVDTPVQLRLYKNFPSINYIIHGHAYIKDAVFTKEYFPCGDMREVDAIIRATMEKPKGFTRMNLKGHGFILMGTNIVDMQKHLDECEFYQIGG